MPARQVPSILFVRRGIISGVGNARGAVPRVADRHGERARAHCKHTLIYMQYFEKVRTRCSFFDMRGKLRKVPRERAANRTQGMRPVSLRVFCVG